MSDLHTSGAMPGVGVRSCVLADCAFAVAARGPRPDLPSIRAVARRRGDGYAVSVDALRLLARVCQRAATKNHNVAMRRRLADFAEGYLS